MPDAILFSVCKGLNDTGTASVNPKTGESDVKFSDGVTVDYNGDLVGAPGLGLIEEFTQEIKAVSAGKYVCIVQLDNYLYTYDGTTFSIVVNSTNELITVVGTATFVHTNLDVRFVSDSIVYRISNDVATPATVGAYAGPATSKVFYAMPVFDGGFLYNGRLYIWKDNFIQYSEHWYWDCWDLANAFIGFDSKILQAGAIYGCVCILCEDRVIALVGLGPETYRYIEYGVIPKANTLWSGYADKAGYLHVFVGETGIYSIDGAGQLTNFTATKVETETSFGGTFVGGYASHSKYFAKGNPVSFEYDFVNKIALGNINPTVEYATSFNGQALYVQGNGLYTDAVAGEVEINILLPDCDFNSKWAKRINRLYVSGEFVGDLQLTVHYKDSESFSQRIGINGIVSDEVITGFGVGKSAYVSIEVSFTGTYFYLDSIRCIYSLHQ